MYITVTLTAQSRMYKYTKHLPTKSQGQKNPNPQLKYAILSFFSILLTLQEMSFTAFYDYALQLRCYVSKERKKF